MRHLGDMSRQQPLRPQKTFDLDFKQVFIHVERLGETSAPAMLANELLQSRRSAHVECPPEPLGIPHQWPLKRGNIDLRLNVTGKHRELLIKTSGNDEIVPMSCPRPSRGRME